MNAVTASAAPAAAPRALKLPADWVRVTDQGRIVSDADFVLAVGVSPAVFLVVYRRLDVCYASPIPEQLAGYLMGRGAAVVRTILDFPWWLHQAGTLDQTVLGWVKHFLAEGRQRRLFMSPPPYVRPPILLPLTVGAENGRIFWEEAQLVIDALATAHPTAVPKIRQQLWELAALWEEHWNAVLAMAAEHSPEGPEAWASVYAVDRAWSQVVKTYLGPEGYVMSAASIARLL